MRTGAARAGLTSEEAHLFLERCEALHLDPNSGQVYPEKQDGEVVVIVPIASLRAMAERTGQLAGFTAPEWLCGGSWSQTPFEGADGARIGVYREGWDEPVYGVALCCEFKRDTSPWHDRPTHQLLIAAERQAIVRAFSLETLGIDAREVVELEAASKATETPEEQLTRLLIEWTGDRDKLAARHSMELLKEAIYGSRTIRLEPDQVQELIGVIDASNNSGMTLEHLGTLSRRTHEEART